MCPSESNRGTHFLTLHITIYRWYRQDGSELIRLCCSWLMTSLYAMRNQRPHRVSQWTQQKHLFVLFFCFFHSGEWNAALVTLGTQTVSWPTQCKTSSRLLGQTGGGSPVKVKKIRETAWDRTPYWSLELWKYSVLPFIKPFFMKNTKALSSSHRRRSSHPSVWPQQFVPARQPDAQLQGTKIHPEVS